MWGVWLESVSLDLCQKKRCLFFIHWSCSTGQEGGGRECPGAQRRRVGGHVRAGAQPAPAWADQGWRRAVEATAADPEEQGLCRQLPHQTCHPEGRAGETEDRAAAGSGQAGPRERQHEAGAGCPASQVRGPAVFRPDCDPRASLAGKGGHHQRHHHRQVGQSQQLQPDPVLGPLLVLTGLGSLCPAWSFPVLTQPEPTHPVLRGRSVVRLRDGMGWQALCDVTLHSRLCLPPSVSFTHSTLSVHCANPIPPPSHPWPPAPAGYRTSVTRPPRLIEILLLLQCEKSVYVACLNVAALVLVCSYTWDTTD